jgi:hypothetical protein
MSNRKIRWIIRKLIINNPRKNVKIHFFEWKELIKNKNIRIKVTRKHIKIIRNLKFIWREQLNEIEYRLFESINITVAII